MVHIHEDGKAGHFQSNFSKETISAWTILTFSQKESQNWDSYRFKSNTIRASKAHKLSCRRKKYEKVTDCLEIFDLIKQESN